MRDYQAQPVLLGHLGVNGTVAVDDLEETVLLGYETSPHDWQAIDTSRHRVPDDWPWRPVRFVDGKDVGRTVAWLQTEEGYPVPVRLAQVGGVVMRNENKSLRREWSQIERVVSLMTELFPADEVQSFEQSLTEQGFHLLAVPRPDEREYFDFERARETTQRRTNYEMNQLEKQGVEAGGLTPTLVDGRLDKHAGAFDPSQAPMLGLVKSHYKRYLDPYPSCWRVFYNLRPGERTPAFAIEDLAVRVVSWYLRLCGSSNEMPNWGIVRLEVPREWFEGEAQRDWSCLDSFSRLVCDYRCRDDSYERAPVSITPIQRAEDNLGALFTQTDTLASRFYHLAGL